MLFILTFVIATIFMVQLYLFLFMYFVVTIHNVSALW